MTSISQPNQTAAHPKYSRWLILAGVVAAIATSVLAWRHFNDQATPQELAAKADLAGLGALVVMDAGRIHVSSVNLSTLASPGAIDAAVAALAALPYLNSLNADHTELRDDHATTIGQLTNLQDLVLSHTHLTDAGLEALQTLSRLKSVHLSDTEMTSAGMNSLGQLRALTVVDVSGTKVTGNFEPLRNLSGLNWLVARRLALDAAAIAAISQCPSLSRVSLNDTTCPPEAVKELAEKRPNLTIDN